MAGQVPRQISLAHLTVLDTTPPEPEPGGIVRRQGARVQARLRPVVTLAETLVDKVRTLALVAALAGAWLWGLLFYPFASFGRLGVLVLAGGVLLVLLAPAGVLGLFWAGLRELIGLPDRLVAMAGTGEERAGDLVETVREEAREPFRLRRLWRFFRTVLDLRGLALDSKGALLQVAVVARLANPLFVGGLFVAFGLSVLLIGVAVVSFIIVFW